MAVAIIILVAVLVFVIGPLILIERTDPNRPRRRAHAPPDVPDISVGNVLGILAESLADADDEPDHGGYADDDHHSVGDDLFAEAYDNDHDYADDHWDDTLWDWEDEP